MLNLVMIPGVIISEDCNPMILAFLGLSDFSEYASKLTWVMLEIYEATLT